MKEFTGTMRVTPKYAKCDPYLVSGKWVYDEGKKWWYHGTTPYNEDIVEIVKIET